MRDFFRVMGKAFAIVFGSTFALALVLALCLLAARPLLRRPPTEPPVATRCLRLALGAGRSSAGRTEAHQRDIVDWASCVGFGHNSSINLTRWVV